jgi:hypothetical protein
MKFFVYYLLVTINTKLLRLYYTLQSIPSIITITIIITVLLVIIVLPVY